MTCLYHDREFDDKVFAEGRALGGNPIDGMSCREFLAKIATAASARARMLLAGLVIEKAYDAGPCSDYLTDMNTSRC
ncbi:hypothetical protein [Mycobacterium uberis]|uniref:hypothetical protein n=1 Tax=Mycobacterium uberis TaxID=2162698 RepID=UPI001FB535D9|nr:hypothetical protein [Mycobacterium uberis]